MENPELEIKLQGKTIQKVDYPDHEGNFVKLYFTDSTSVIFAPIIYQGELTYLNSQFTE